MTDIDIAALEKLAEGLPRNARGPGGAIGVVHEGRVVLRHAWGHATTPPSSNGVAIHARW